MPPLVRVRGAVLLVELGGEEEDVVDADREDEEGEDLGDDERRAEAEGGEEADRGGDGDQDDEDAPQT